MTTRFRILTLVGALLLFALPWSVHAQTTHLQYQQARSQAGLNTFETTKADTVEYDGFEVDWGAAFTQQFQGLTHSNEADAVMNPDGQNVNALTDIGNGFNLATANLYLGAQLADGISVNLTTYLSSRHHPEAWVKGGYLQVDKAEMLGSSAVNSFFDIATVKVGHFEINYGDTHFRRTDNGNAMYNPFVGNYIMDSFTTEIGAEFYLKPGDFLAMVAVTGGEIRGAVERPEERAPSFYGKLGYDSQVSENLRLRLTGSGYFTQTSLNNTLHSGDRAGSRYYSVINDNPRNEDYTGRVNAGFRDKVTAFMINPFVKFKGLELFGVAEFVQGRSSMEDDTRSVQQYGGEVVYRFLDDDLYLGGRYNLLTGDVTGSGEDVSVDRFQIGGGWFITKNVLAKFEYMQQTYNDYPSMSIFHEGEFSGFMIEGVVMF
jgi:hypothetical protein